MAGRKSKIHDAGPVVVQAIETGMTDRDACAVAGIDESTFYRWIERNSEFRDTVTRARPRGWLSALAIIKREAVQNRDWRAAGDFLDRTRSPYRKTAETVLSNAEQGQPFVLKLEVVE